MFGWGIPKKNDAQMKAFKNIEGQMKEFLLTHPQYKTLAGATDALNRVWCHGEWDNAGLHGKNNFFNTLNLPYFHGVFDGIDLPLSKG